MREFDKAIIEMEARLKESAKEIGIKSIEELCMVVQMAMNKISSELNLKNNMEKAMEYAEEHGKKEIN